VISDGEPVPGWLRELADAAGKMEINPLAQPPVRGGRASAVLVLFGGGPDDPDLLFIPRTGFRVVPVLAWWRQPGAVAPVDPAEVAAVERVTVGELVDPATRVMVRGPGGFLSPAFRVKGMLIWGFTAVLVDRLLALGGWERPWDNARVIDL